MEGAIMATVLVVDDSAVDRHRVGGLLAKHPPLTAVYAATGAEALEVIDRAAPDAVLTDLRMPVMNGLELVEAIKSKAPGLPVILMTAYGSEDIATLALQRGAASYVPKRNLSRQLFETLSNVLEVTQANRGHRQVLACLRQSQLEFVLDNDPGLIPHLVGHLRENLLGMRLCNENEVIRVGMALREALMNAIWHGNLELGPTSPEEREKANEARIAERRQQPPYRDRRAHLLVKESRDEVLYVIRDEGAGFNPSLLPGLRDPATWDKFGDRGLVLIRTFMDEVRYNKNGNEITMLKRRGT
jgi:CheY-like chemotaxis protein/anti-sigma regulatory factor (Ser/Thr protein kinase)